MIATAWWDGLAGAASSIEDAILALTGSAWIYPSVWAVTVIDGVFPPVPSESVVIAAATAWAQTGHPALWLVWVAAAAGAWCGDQVAYAIGRTIPVAKVPLLRGPRGRATLAWADRALEHRGTSFIIAARFIPVGRVAVNLTAGALRFPRRRFMGVDSIGAMIWATYSIVLGVSAGSLLENSLLISIVIGVVGGIALGYLVDFILGKLGVQPPEMVPVEELPTEGPIARRRAKRSPPA